MLTSKFQTPNQQSWGAPSIPSSEVIVRTKVAMNSNKQQWRLASSLILGVVASWHRHKANIKRKTKNIFATCTSLCHTMQAAPVTSGSNVLAPCNQWPPVVEEVKSISQVLYIPLTSLHILQGCSLLTNAAGSCHASVRRLATHCSWFRPIEDEHTKG